jgi:hypothetical protein
VLAAIDWDALLTVVWAASAAGIGATTAYGLAILGGTRALDLGRSGRTGAAALYGLVGAIGVGAVVVGVAFGIVVLIES